MNRRNALKILGGGVILATGGLGYKLTRLPDTAVAPWEWAGREYNEPRMRALSYAILAPNPHNRQPWIVDLSQPGKVTLLPDMDRLLPHTDPYNRQITIGFGCFIELLSMAAAKDGYELDIKLFPLGEDPTQLQSSPVAEITFEKSARAKPDDLFGYVLDRRSLKVPYDLERKLDDDILRQLVSVGRRSTAIGATNDESETAALRDLTSEALELEILTPRTYRESVDLFRIGKKEVEQNPDGIDFSGPMFELLALTGTFTRKSALDVTSSSYRQGLETVLATTNTAMGHVWITTAHNTRIDQINAGRDWLRVNLATTKLGVGTQPLSQALQEYPEMESLYNQVHQLLAPKGGTIQMLGRLGYAAAVPPSPRWPLDKKILG